MAVLAVVALVGGRLVQLQTFAAPAYAASADEQRLRTTTLPALRGTISDRSGQALALSVQARAVFAEPHNIAKAVCEPDAKKPCDVPSIAAALAPVIGVEASEIAAKINRASKYVVLARGLDPKVGVQVRKLALPGIGVNAESRRVHPAGDLAANVLGFTDGEGKGLGGVESGWEKVLAGKDGKAVAQVDRGGRVIPTAEKSQVEPAPGRDVQLTIDRDLQWYAQDLLNKKVAETQAENGTVVVMDVQNGELLALASSPTFNPDDRRGVDPKALGNPAIRDVYEPGSVAKIVTAAGALEAGVVTPDTVLTVPDTIQVSRRTFHDSHSHPTERLTFTGVLVQSSNVGTIQIAQKLGPQRLYDAFKRFGFGEDSGLGLPGESDGTVHEVAKWSGTTLPTMAIGQGVDGNVVQIASVYQTVANGGVRVTPSIVKQVAGTAAKAPESRRVVSEEVAKQLRDMLEGVVTAEGTAPLAAIPGYRIAGKTGTAQRVVDGRYAAGNYTSSFIGFAPADAPRLVTAVVLQGTGKNGYYGGSVAGPVFKDVTSFALRSLKVPPTGTTPPTLRLTEK
jgi:cell division protein FtsI (penicillin-binding protein 3)